MLPFFILTVNEQERALATFLLGDSVIEVSGDYLYGKADPAIIEQIAAEGLLINRSEPEKVAPIAAPAPAVSAIPNPGDAGVTDHSAGDAELSYVTVTMEDALTAARLDAMRSNGLELGRRIGRNTYVGHYPSQGNVPLLPNGVQLKRYGIRATLGDLQNSIDLSWSGNPGGVLPRGGTKAGSPDDAFTLLDDVQAAPEHVEFDVVCHDPKNIPLVASRLRLYQGVSNVQEGRDRLRFAVEPGGEEFHVITALGLDNVVSAVESYVPPELFVSFAAEAVLGSALPPAKLKLHGKGQVIGIADTGIDAEHPDLEGRVEVSLRATPQSPRDPRGHGTHVASIAAGNGKASTGRLAGLASEANLFVQSLADENLKIQVGVGLKPLLEEAYEHNVRIQNYSWGSPVAGRYTLDADDIDAFVHAHPDMLVIVAGGNSGVQGPVDEMNGRAALGSLASPACAKNCLTVGATCSPRTDGPYEGKKWSNYDGANPPRFPPMSNLPLTGTADIIAALSSRGPSDDGRIKPDLVAPGVGIAAARSADCEPRHPLPGFDDLYQFSSGTSMAAPLVAGAAAVLRQYYMEFRGHVPSAALLKATLVNATRWINGELWEDASIGKPNFHQGFGFLELGKAFPMEDSVFVLEFVDINSNSAAALRQGGANARWTRNIKVLQGTPLSITMVWTDPPGRHLQHELDLVVLSPTGKKLVGNEGLKHLAFQAVDMKNNVERIFVEEPEAGIWSVNVFARNTYKGAQGFSVAMTASFDKT